MKKESKTGDSPEQPKVVNSMLEAQASEEVNREVERDLQRDDPTGTAKDKATAMLRGNKQSE